MSARLLLESWQRVSTYPWVVHRAWIDLRGAVGQGISAMLEEAERGEDYIKQKYEEVPKETAGSAVTDVLSRQYREVEATHGNIRHLRDSFQET